MYLWRKYTAIGILSAYNYCVFSGHHYILAFISHSDSIIVGRGKLSCWPVMPTTSLLGGGGGCSPALCLGFHWKVKAGYLYREVAASYLDVFHFGIHGQLGLWNVRVYLLFISKVTLEYLDLNFVCKRSVVECHISIIGKIIFSCSGFFFF